MAEKRLFVLYICKNSCTILSMKAKDFSKLNRAIQKQIETGNQHHSPESERDAERLLLLSPEELEQYLDRQMMKAAIAWAVDNLGSQPLRAIKNGLISLITVVCRAAIRYGVDAEFSYTLSDYYIAHLETMQTPEKTMDLMKTILLHYNSLARAAKPLRYCDRVNRAIEYINRNLYAPMKVSSVAQTVGLEPHYFAALFKKETGVTPYRYILQRKLEAAKDMLAHTRYPATDIASTLGFYDLPHFEKRFREEYGITPLAYREKHDALET